MGKRLNADGRKYDITNLRTPTLKTQICEQILNLIVSGKLSPGDTLPAERPLSDELGVSRTVLREAISTLQTRGVLTAVRGKGVIVNPTDSSDISRAFMLYMRRKNLEIPIKDLFDLRFILEPEIVRMATEMASEDDLLQLEGILHKMQASKQDLKEFSAADLSFHLKVTTITQNIFFITIMEELIVPIRDSFEAQVDTERVLREHTLIYEKMKRRDSAGAVLAMKKSLQYSYESLKDKRL